MSYPVPPGQSTRAKHAENTTATSTSSSPSSSALRIAVQKSLPHHTPLSQSPPPQQRAFTVSMRGVPPPNSSSSSPPTPSPLSTSGSDGGRHGAPPADAATAGVAQAGRAPSPGRVPETSIGATTLRRDGRGARKPHQVPSASIHSVAMAAAAAATTDVGTAATTAATVQWGAGGLNQTAEVGHGGNGGGGDGAVAAAPVIGVVSSPQLSRPLTTDQEEEEKAAATAAANAKEVQRQQILAHANDLLTFCAISNKVTSIRQCTSSFFVLLYQRLFDCTIAGIDRSPNTAEKRRHNVTLVLEQLRQHPYSLAGIEAEEVVKLNEDHISRLIMVFVQIAEDMRRQQQQRQMEQGSSTPPLVTVPTHPVASTAAAGAAQHIDVVHAGMSGNGGAYVPVGYTVAEVMPGSITAAQQIQQQQQQQLLAMEARNAAYSYATPPGAALPGAYHHRHGVNGFFIAPAPPLNGGLGDPTGAVSLNVQQQHQQQQQQQQQSQQQYVNPNPYDPEESPSSVSYYLDSSAIPTDELLAEWYRNLVYPAPHTPESDRSSSSAILHHYTTTPSSDVDNVRRGDAAAAVAKHSRPTRPAHKPTSADTSSAVPLHTSGSPHATRRSWPRDEGTPRRRPVAAAGAAATTTTAAAAGGGGGGGGAAAGARRSRKLSGQAQRAQLDAHDIIRRCQRLGEALDAQEGRHRRAFVPKTPSPHRAGAARVLEQNSSRLHRGLPVRGNAEEAQGTAQTDRQPPRVRSNVAAAALRHDGEQESVLASTPASAPQAQGQPEEQQARKQLQERSAAQPVHQKQQQKLLQPPLPPPQLLRQPALHHRLTAEPPLTRQEKEFLLRRPLQHSEAAQRDRKIERLRAARYLGDLQQLLRRRMRHEYDAQMSAMRGSLREALRTAKAEKADLMQRVRDENERYRAAYATLMEAAANEAQVPARVMSRHTAQLADYYATSLQHSQAMCDALKREMDRRTRAELLQYAEEVSAWQQHFLL